MLPLISQLLLLPTANAMPAIDSYFERWPEDGPVSEEELREAVRVANGYVTASSLLLGYAQMMSGKPSRN